MGINGLIDRDFKVTIFFDIDYLRNDTSHSMIVIIEHQYEVLGSLSNNDIFNDLHEHLTWFQGIGIFEVLWTSFL